MRSGCTVQESGFSIDTRYKRLDGFTITQKQLEQDLGLSGYPHYTVHVFPGDSAKESVLFSLYTRSNIPWKCANPYRALETIET